MKQHTPSEQLTYGSLHKELGAPAASGHGVLERWKQVAFAGSPRQVAQLQRLDTLQKMSSEVGTSSSDHLGGLPDSLKNGIESLSGVSMDAVRVHYNSAKPAQFRALAYAQGTDIHLASGQEKHLPHEAWHVVQQAQRRVSPTRELGGVAVNQDQCLEKEADIMGAKAATSAANKLVRLSDRVSSPFFAPTVQCKISYARGKYKSKEALIEALNETFGEKAKERIIHWVGEYEKANWTEFASAIFAKIATQHLPGDGFRPTYAVVDSTGSGSEHGPMLPERVDRTSAPDTEKALGTFNFSSVTLAKLTAIGGGGKVVFHDRQIDANFHAEDGLVEQLEAYFEKNKIDTEGLYINLTINNFFCAHGTTKKSNKSNHCLGKIIELQKRHSFARFHVYFQNTYGKEDLMSESIEMLQSAGILVSSFTSIEKIAPYVNKSLDPHSDSEDEDWSLESSSLLGRAREYWEQEIENCVEQTNAQYDDNDDFEPVDYDDVEEFMKEQVESAFELDYIENESEFDIYIDEINIASAKFIRSMIRKYA